MRSVLNTILCLVGVTVLLAPALGSGAAENRRAVVVLGDSIAAGYGVNPEEAFPALLQRKIDEARLPFEIVNAGVSGDTTAGGLRRLDWILRRPVSVLVIELGGNDGLRGIAPEATRSNLLAIIDRTAARQPGAKVVLAGMQMPPNMGEEYTRRFAAIYPEIAKARSVPLVPHLLEGVGGRPDMNLPDLIHPTPAGHQLVASNVWTVLKPVLEAPDARP